MDQQHNWPAHDRRPPPRVGTGTFQWSIAGWFGGILGCTAWLAAIAIVQIRADPAAAGAAAAAFVVINAFGLALWSRRHLIAPYAAVQWLLIVTMIGAAALCLYLNGRPNPVLGNGIPWWVLLLFPFLMLTSWMQNRRR